ncbi:hypothetical protein [Rhodopirellula sp. P2]|uniref:hypothetical protein n=1 Tax=Rhodopirellula sp. P2 TaxID=2127060 RepID=UPI002368E20A|nr:hypothetical protein [Rhodopirellula sp. P2]WDQ16789.1 hypothetical protein PSR62_24700 [Rhodopirellula sp. P2]
MLPRATGANAQTAHIVAPDHSCRPASTRVQMQCGILVASDKGGSGKRHLSSQAVCLAGVTFRHGEIFFDIVPLCVQVSLGWADGSIVKEISRVYPSSIRVSNPARSHPARSHPVQEVVWAPFDADVLRAGSGMRACLPALPGFMVMAPSRIWRSFHE